MPKPQPGLCSHRLSWRNSHLYLFECLQPFNWVVSSNGTVLQGGTATSNSITITWNDGPLGTISLSATACSGATCPIAGTINIPVVSDNAAVKSGERSACALAPAKYILLNPLAAVASFGPFQVAVPFSEGQGSNRIKN